MVIDMAVLGAITLAGGALSTGNHIITNKRLRKLEKDNKIRTVEVSVLEVGLISTVGCSIIKERQMKKKMNQFKQDVNDRLIEYENEIAAIENELAVMNSRIDAMRIDDVAMQNEIINAKVDHIANVVDIATAEDDK